MGGLVGAALAHEGDRVTLLVRPQTHTLHPGMLRLKRPYDTIGAPVRIETRLAEPVDVLWLAVKAHQLVAALRAAADGAVVDREEILAKVEALPATMRSSMQKDLSAGRMPELDAIGGAIIRAGRNYGLDVPATRKLVAEIQERLSKLHQRTIMDGMSQKTK